MPARVLVCFAVEQEAQPLRELVAGLEEVRVLVTGMGRVNAAEKFEQAVSAWEPAVVITSGFAGGLNPALRTGTIVFAADGETHLQASLLAAGAVEATFHCADRVAITAAEKHQLRDAIGADAVEMESGIIRRIARQHRLPSATIRVILDAAGQDLPLDFNALVDEQMRIVKSKLSLAILRAPQKIPELMRLQKESRYAAGVLATTLLASIKAIRDRPPDRLA